MQHRHQFLTTGMMGLGLGLMAAIFAGSVQAAELEPVRGVVKARHEAILSVDLKARVLETPVRTGESFSRDDVLLTFDCDVLNAEVKAAQAAYQVARSKYKSNIEMETYGAVGKFDVQSSKAEMNEAMAQADASIARTKYCIIKAPYDGKVAELAINPFETPRPDQSLMKIVSVEDYELKFIVPSAWLSWLAPGHKMMFDVDENGKRYEATVAQIGAEVDAVSRTVAIIAKFNKHPQNILPGMSGAAFFNTPLAESSQ